MTQMHYICGVAVVFLMLAGCTTSRVEMDYGVSHKLAIANQTLYPEAGSNLEPVKGLDAPAADKSYDRYVKGFEKQEPRPTYLLNIGGQGSK